jgi:apyrase
MKKLLCTLLALSFWVSSALHAATSSQYALIIDAGSTGSRLHLFEYSKENKIPVIQDVFSENVKPGLSSYEKKPEAAGPSLKKLLDDALLELQKKQIEPSSVTISVLGTAGLRLLPKEKQEAIYQNVSLYLTTHYNFKLKTLETISGKMEGLFGWLDVNYLLNNFEGSEDKTAGSIDVGGASTQIVFSTTDKRKAADELELKIGETHYTLYSKSFLGLGLVEALNYVNTQPLASTCYPAHYPVNNTTQGNFNLTSCGNLYLELINLHEVKQQLPSLAKKNFIAYSGAYYTDNFFGIDKTPSKEQAHNKVQAVCNQTWEQLVETYPQVPEKYLSLYCANGVYLSQLFYETYQLEEQKLTITNQLNQKDLDWTLGALLYQLVSE